LEKNIDLAHLLFQQKKYQKTIDTCNDLLDSDDKSIEALKLIAKSLVALKNIEDSREYINRALNIKPDDYELIKDLGNSYQLMGDVKTAIYFYKKALSIKSDYSSALTNLGSIILNTGDKQEALSLLIKATKYNPKLAPAWANLANGYFKLNKIQEAEISARKSIEIDPNHFNSNFLLSSILITSKKLKEAEEALHKTITLKPDSIQVNLKLGSVLKDIGKLQEAEKYTRKAIDLNPNLFNSHFLLALIQIKQKNLLGVELSLRKTIQLKPDFVEAYSNLAATLKELGKPKEAEIIIRKAIKINPNIAMLYFNLGSILSEIGKYEEAELSTRKAIQIEPSFYKAYINLGNILNNIGQTKLAIEAEEKAISLQSEESIAHISLGNIFADNGQNKEAFDSFLSAFEIISRKRDEENEIYYYITQFLKGANPFELDELKIKFILKKLLYRNDIEHIHLFKSFERVYREIVFYYLEKINSDYSSWHVSEKLIQDQIIIQALKKIVFRDPNWEKILISLRKDALNIVELEYELKSNNEYQLIIALAHQCFFNEYIFPTSDEESKSISNIMNRCNSSKISELDIAILACYFPLYKLLDQLPSIKSIAPIDEDLKELIKVQILEPLEELKIKKSIKRIGIVNDSTSIQVESQYEDNPFPRWKNANEAKELKFSGIKVINAETSPNVVDPEGLPDKLNILIAGCGTGKQIFHAQRYNNSKITAIDLSASSLAYAQRQINQSNINNVTLYKMDLLDLSLLQTKFDVIECVGVLHHMSDPLKGLKSLLKVSNQKCYLKLGLYSEIANDDVIRSCKYIKENKLKPTKKDINKFREDVLSRDFLDISDAARRHSFYTLSECRDFYFHYQAHRYNLRKLEQILILNQLKFEGFLLPKSIKSLYKTHFLEDKAQTNLKNWAKFEEKYPYIFRDKYQFWVSKDQ